MKVSRRRGTLSRTHICLVRCTRQTKIHSIIASLNSTNLCFRTHQPTALCNDRSQMSNPSAPTPVKPCHYASHCNRHLTSNERTQTTCPLLKASIVLLATNTAIKIRQMKTKRRLMLSPCAVRNHWRLLSNSSNPNSTLIVILRQIKRIRCHSLPGSV